MEDASEFIEKTKKICMRFDFEKRERVSQIDEINYMKGLLRKDSISFNTKPIQGYFDEVVKYDLVIDDYGFKFFAFEDKNLKRMISSVKSWAFTAGSLREMYKTIFVIDVEDVGSKEFDILKSILKKNGVVLTSTEAVDFVCSLASRKA